jgi:hypothetical protein
VGRDETCKGSGEWTPDHVDQLRRRVKFFFMDPWSKFKARKHLPWKMFMQLLKIILITVQVIYHFLSFKHLFQINFPKSCGIN